MKSLTLSISLLLTVVIFSSCKLHREFTGQEENKGGSAQIEKTQEKNVILGFERTPCFGQCPYFKVKIYSDGTAHWEGLNFVERMGHYKAKVNVADLQPFLNQAKELDFMQLPDTIKSGVSDLPSAVVTLRYGGKTKTVRDESSGSDELRALEKQIDNYVNGLNWVFDPEGGK